MIKFTFLGANESRQDADCGNTSLLLSGDRGVLCVDLSGNVEKIVGADVDTVLLTHEHIDHVYALPSLLHQLWLSGRDRELKIVVPEGMQYIPEGMIELFKFRSKKNIFKINVVSEKDFQVGSLSVQTFVTDHTLMSVGIVVTEGNNKLVYTCDTRPINQPLSLMAGAKVLIHEASGLAEYEETLIKKGHSSAADAAEFAKKISPERLFLCHLPQGSNAKEAVLKEAKSFFEAAYIPEILVEYTV